jgi:GTP-binding protein Era
MTHRSGFVSIIGYPNTGKSTLMNSLLGERLSIVSPKAQTTRHRIMGILSGEDFQIVYSDTPGVLRPNYLLQESMLSAVMASLTDADVVLLVTEPAEPFRDDKILEKIGEHNIPVVVVVNKIDLSSQEAVMAELAAWGQRIPGCTAIPASALHKFNLGKVLDAILEYLPEGPGFYPKDELTDRSERFFISEIIRGQLLLQYGQEIPYSCEVTVNSFKEEGQLVRIQADIWTERESQKAIVLGHQGTAIKKLGTASRKEAEQFLGKKVFLELRVKVEKNWREDRLKLRRFGYLADE